MTAPAKDRGGRPVDLGARLGKLAREHGIDWLTELDRQARLGDVNALSFLVEHALSRFTPRPEREH